MKSITCSTRTGTAQRRRSNDGVNFVNDGSAMAGNSVNDVTSNARFYDLSPIATATVSVVAHGVRRAV
jgi:hypothetical protein